MNSEQLIKIGEIYKRLGDEYSKKFFEIERNCFWRI